MISYFNEISKYNLYNNELILNIKNIIKNIMLKIYNKIIVSYYDSFYSIFKIDEWSRTLKLAHLDYSENLRNYQKIWVNKKSFLYN